MEATILKRRPTTPGFYWWRPKRPKQQKWACICYVFDHDGELAVWFPEKNEMAGIGSVYALGSIKNSEWAGPIPTPS